MRGAGSLVGPTLVTQHTGKCGCGAGCVRERRYLENRSGFRDRPCHSIRAVSPTRRPSAGACAGESGRSVTARGERFPPLPPCTSSSHPTEASKTILCPPVRVGLLASVLKSRLPIPLGLHDPAGQWPEPGGRSPLWRHGPQSGATAAGFPLGQRADGVCAAPAPRAVLGQGGELPDRPGTRSRFCGFYHVNALGKVHGLHRPQLFGLQSLTSVTSATCLLSWQGQSGPHLGQDTVAGSAARREHQTGLGLLQGPRRPAVMAEGGSPSSVALRTSRCSWAPPPLLDSGCDMGDPASPCPPWGWPCLPGPPSAAVRGSTWGSPRCTC